MDKNEQTARKLDEEFKLALGAIRPFILRLSSVEDATLCRLWLKKLHESVTERVLRNNFLKELTEQVKSGFLQHPFNVPPTELPLSSQTAVNHGDNWSVCSSSLCYGDTHKEKHYGEFGTDEQREQGQTGYKTTDSDTSYRPKPPKGRRRSEPFTLTRWRQAPEEPAKTYKPPTPHQEKGEEKTETSRTLMKTITSLRAQNEALVHEVCLYQQTNQIAQKNLHMVNQEVVMLRSKLSELQRINSCIEKSHANVVSEYRKALNDTIRQVTDRLKTANEKTEELRNDICSLEARVEHEQQAKFEEMESKLSNEIHRLKMLLGKEKKKYQTEIGELQSVIGQKEEQVKKQCSRMQEEVSHIKQEMDHVASEGQSQLKTKISTLKKDVSKLEKANKKLIAEYESRMAHCRKEHEMQIRSLKAKLLQKGGNTDNLESTVIELEKRYRKLLSDLEARAALQRKHDNQRIRELEEQLMKFKKY